MVCSSANTWAIRVPRVTELIPITFLTLSTDYFYGKTGLSPSLIAEHFPGTVTDFTACSLPPPSAFTFDLLPKCDDVILFYFIYLHTSPTYQVALAPFHQKRCHRPYLCFYHTSPLIFRTFSLPPSTTETTFTLPQFGQSRLL